MGLVTTRERSPSRRYGPATNALNPRPRTERGGSEGSPSGVTRPLTLIPSPARPKPCVDWPATQEQPSLASAEIGWVRYGAPHTPLVSSLIPRRAGSQACRRPYSRRVASRGLDVGDRPYRRGGNRAEGIPPASPGDSRGTLNFLSCHSGGRELVHLNLNLRVDSPQCMQQGRERARAPRHGLSRRCHGAAEVSVALFADAFQDALCDRGWSRSGCGGGSGQRTAGRGRRSAHGQG